MLYTQPPENFLKKTYSRKRYESGLIGLVGGAFGTILGTGIAFFIGELSKNAGFLLIIKIELLVLLFGLLFAFFVGVLSGILPAMQASKLKPVDALRYE